MKPLAIILAVIFIVLAICAIVGVNAGVHALGLDGTRHTKHAVIYAVLAILSLVWLRFQNNAAIVRR